ncbi:MAG: hypothetical protein MUQ30_05355 [Anaerolineae bacterium]|nr:hypothetical protein [Anaerolineae bacterium]
MRVLKIIGKAAVAFYEELFFHFGAGLVHIVCWLLIIPGPFALAGIYAIGQRAARGKAVSWRLIWDTIKEFGVRSFLLFLIILVGFAIVAVNLWFYNTPEISPFPASVKVWTTPIFIIIGVVWAAVAFYAQAFLMELEDPKMLVVLRNSLFLTVLKPLNTLGFLLVSALVTALSIALPILLVVLPGFLSTLSLTAVRTLMADLTERAKTMDKDKEAVDLEDQNGAGETATEGQASQQDDDRSPQE